MSTKSISYRIKKYNITFDVPGKLVKSEYIVGGDVFRELEQSKLKGIAIKKKKKKTGVIIFRIMF